MKYKKKNLEKNSNSQAIEMKNFILYYKAKISKCFAHNLLAG